MHASPAVSRSDPNTRPTSSASITKSYISRAGPVFEKDDYLGSYNLHNKGF